MITFFSVWFGGKMHAHKENSENNVDTTGALTLPDQLSRHQDYLVMLYICNDEMFPNE